MLFALAMVLLPSRASAQDDDEAARTHFLAGRQYYDSGAYEDAAREFQRSYELSARPELLMNLYTVYERLGRWQEAADNLERYLAEGEPDRRAQLEQRLERLRERIVRTESDSSAQGERSSGRVEAEGEQSPAQAQAGSADDGLTVAGAVTASLGGLGLLSFTGFAVVTAVHHGNLTSSCSPGCSASAIAEGETYALIADISLGVGVAAAVAGAILLVLGLTGSSEEHESAVVAPWLSTEGAGLAFISELP